MFLTEASKVLGSLGLNPGVTLSIIMGVFTAGFVWALFSLVKKTEDPLRRRIDAVAHTGEPEHTPAPKIKFQKKIAAEGVDDLSELHQQFIFAGYRNSRDVSLYYTAKLILTIGLPVTAYYTANLLPELNTKHIFLMVMASLAIGFIAPGIYLDQRTKKRQSAILNGFPDMLDLLVACSEAGLGLNAALQRVTNEISLSYPELAGELHTVNLEMRAGVDRMDALKGLADRTGIDELSGLVSMLRQSIRFGTGVSDTLRIYSEEFRDRRMQRAEAVASAIGTKMIFPLILCIFPAFFVVAIGPAAINIMEVLGSG